MTRATCDACDTAFDVPDVAKTYRCKACGGRVAVRSEEIADERACPACGAIHVDGEVRFCEECGASLDGGSTSPQEVEERRRANKELAKAKASVRAVRMIFIVGAVLAALRVVLVVVVVMALGNLGGVLLLVFALSAMIFTVYLAGALRIFREPLLWTVLIASLETVELGMSVVQGAWIRAALLLLWCAVLWSAVARVTRVRRLIQRYPDLWHAATIAKLRRIARGGRGARALGVSRQRHVSQARDARRRLLVAGGVVVALVVLGVGWKIATRPPALDDAVASFSDDWSRSDVEAVSRWFSADRRAKVARWLVKKSSRRDWSARLPSLQTGRVMTQSEARARVAFATIDGDVLTTWRLEDAGWSISSIKVEYE